MPVQITRGATDSIVDQIAAALEAYTADHPLAEAAVYRHDPVSVRVRVIDPDFAGVGRSERHTAVWRYLDAVPDEVVSDISMLVPITPDERTRSGSNLEFEDPVTD